MDLVTHRAHVSDVSVFTNPKTSNRSVMLRLKVEALEDPNVVGFLPLTDTVVGGKSKYAGKKAVERTKALLAAAVPSCVEPDGSMNLDKIEGAEILATFDEEGGLVSVSNRGPRSI